MTPVYQITQRQNVQRYSGGLAGLGTLAPWFWPEVAADSCDTALVGAPWYCSGGGMYVFQDCREMADLYDACRSGLTPTPPQVPGPTVPPGGYSGPVTDPNAVDVMLSQSQANIRTFFTDWFTGLDAKVNPPKPQPQGENWVAIAVLVGIGLMAWRH
jgi:hypothetical protein